MADATGPTVEFFETDGTQPGVNSDYRVQVSLNGKLVVASRVEKAGTNTDRKVTVSTELYGVNWMQFDNLVGRLLTLCDATFTDPTQRKAFKDMVRQHVKNWVNDIIVEASADAGKPRVITAPFVGGVLDQPGGLFGVEGEPTP